MRTVNPQTRNPQTKNGRLEISGGFPVDVGIPPLKIKNLLESNPLRSRFVVCGLTDPARIEPPNFRLLTWWIGQSHARVAPARQQMT